MAINFPATAGQPTDGSFTHTDIATGLLYYWDGSSWSSSGSPAGGGGSSYTDLDVDIHLNTSTANSGEILSWNGTDYDWVADQTGSGGGATTLEALTDTDIDTAGTGPYPLADGQILKWNSSLSAWQNVPDTVSSIDGGYFGNSVQIEGNQPGTQLQLSAGSDPVAISDNNFSTGTAGQVLTATGDDGSGNATGVAWTSAGGLLPRQTASATTALIGNNVAYNLSVVAAKGYVLLKIQTSHAAWVTVYTDSASRNADAGRTENTDALPGSGVIAEVITNGSATQVMTPGVFGFNNEAALTSDVLLKVVNKSGADAQITVTLTYIQLEV